MLSLSENNQTDIVETFNSTSRYLDDLLNIDNPYFEHMVGQKYSTELQLNKANSADTEVPFSDLDLSITNDIVSSMIYDKRDDINFEIVNYPFLDGDVPRSLSYGVYILQLFCNRTYQNLYCMVIKFINSKELLGNLFLVINSKRLSSVIKKKFYITWISCDSLHAWL